MAQTPHIVSLPVRDSRGWHENSLAGLIEWHIASVAVARARPAASGEVAAVLAAWRATERQLSGHLEASPERARLSAELVRLRAKYHRLFEARLDADEEPVRIGPTA